MSLKKKKMITHKEIRKRCGQCVSQRRLLQSAVSWSLDNLYIYKEEKKRRKKKEP